MRRVLGGTLLGFGADEECVADLLLAATEACTNVLKHDARCGEYEVSASVGRDDCFLEIASASPGSGARPVRRLNVQSFRSGLRLRPWRPAARAEPGRPPPGPAPRHVTRAGGDPVPVWHGQRSLRDVDAVILPGGFSYGDYLRCGAIARFAPVMSALLPAARAGLPVLGICNGFQILCEAHLLPGALTRNAGLKFVTRDVPLRVENASTAWTRAYSDGERIVVPLKSGEGAYAADADTLAGLEAD